VVKHGADAPAADRALAGDPYECTYDSARTFGDGLPEYPCPNPYHWRNNGFANPHVRFNDHSGSAWPIDQAVYYMGTINGINSYYLWNSCPLDPGARCIDVFSGDYGDDSLFWLTDIFVNASDHSYAEGQTFVGHVLGLGHSSDLQSLMYHQQQLSPLNINLSGDDLHFIETLYSIAW
jgi:hypothetical protein